MESPLAPLAIQKVDLRYGPIECADISPDGRIMVFGNIRGHVIFWDMSSNSEMHKVVLPNNWEIQITFPKNGDSWDGIIRVRNLIGGPPAQCVQGGCDGDGGGADQKTPAIILPDCSHVNFKIEGCPPYIDWTAPSMRKINHMGAHDDTVSCVLFTPDGSKVVSCSYDNTIRMWSVESGRELWCMRGSVDDRSSYERPISAAFSPDGSKLVVGTRQGNVYVLSVETRTRLATMKRRHGGEVWWVAFSPDGSKVASCSWDGTCKIWSATHGTLLRILQEYDEELDEKCMVVAYMSNDRIVAGTNKDTCKIWSVDHGTLIQTMTGDTVGREHPDYIISMAFSQDGRYMVTGSTDACRVWDIATGKLVHTMKQHGHGYRVVFARFSKDDQYLVSVCEKNSICTESRYMVSEEILDCICAAYNLPGGVKRQWGTFAGIEKLLKKW